MMEARAAMHAKRDEDIRIKAHNKKMDAANSGGRWLKTGKPNPRYGSAGNKYTSDNSFL